MSWRHANAIAVLCVVGCSGATPQVAESQVVDGAVVDSAVDTADDAVAPQFDDTGSVDGNVAASETSPTDGNVIPGITHDIALGAPITAPDATWTRVEFPTGYCRNGESAHLMVRLNSKSKKFLIYEEGGGACFNDSSCKLLTFDAPSYVLGGGIFNFSRAENPFKDWNVFYVPYCTGDVHAGDIDFANPGPLTGKTNYTGYRNIKLYLSRILATMPDATDEALAGSSAGGFGAGLTAELVARNAPNSVERLTMIDDSGPPMGNKYLPVCLQMQWRSTWGLDNTVLHDCGPVSCPSHSDFITDYVQFLVDKYAKGPASTKFMAGLISSTGDSVISTFFGYGANNCMTNTPLTPAQFKAGLLEFRGFLQPQTDHFGTFYFEGTSHTTLIMDSGSGVVGGLYDTKVGTVKLTDWLADLLAHKQVPHVGP